MPKFELEKIAFINPNDLTETVVLSTILEGAPSATRSFVEEEPEAYITEDNQEVKDGQIFTLTVATRDDSLIQLMTWADNNTSLSVSGYAYDKFLQIDNVYLTARAESNERKIHVMTAQKSGKLGYDSNGKLDTEFMMSENGLNMFYWQEGATAGVAAGWEDDVDGTFSFSAGEQTIDFTGGTGLSVMSRDIYFPFQKQLTFFIDVTSVTGTPIVGLYEYDENDTSSINSFDIFSSTGIQSISATIDSTTIKVQVRVSLNDDEVITFRNPGINLGSTTNYVSQ